jgi:hypothetical protein
MTERAPLAAILFRAGEPVDDIFAQLIALLPARGATIGGVVQSPCGETVLATHIETGRQVDIMQNLGACSEGCRLDTGALAEAAGLLARSLAARPDLLIVSRFGRAEAEGGGFLAEIGEAAVLGQPTLIGVSAKHEALWRAYAQDFAETLPCALAPVLDWWEQVLAETKLA